MKKALVFIGLVVLILAVDVSISRISKKTSVPEMLEPTEGDEGKYNKAREQWWELIHSAAPGTDWRAIEAFNRQQVLENKRDLKKSYGNAKVTTETFANGNLSGVWSERGSTNQVGSAIGVDYVPETNSLYVLGSGVSGGGGSLWKGTLAGNNWTVLNDDIIFNSHVLKVLTKTAGGQRILAINGKNVVYSDDDGASFNTAGGLSFPVPWDGNIVVSLVTLNDAAKTIYCLTRPWDDVSWSPKFYLYQSVNYGTTFNKIYTFNASDELLFSLNNPYNTNTLYALDNQSVPGKLKLFSISGSTVTPVNEATFAESNSRCVLKGQYNGSALTLYALLNNTKLYRSINSGASWTLQSSLPESSFDRLDVSYNDPARVYFGGVNAYRSYNSGQNWTIVNQWYDYISQPATKLHADIMEIAQFKKADGSLFSIINNHGGVAVSYDDLQTTQNLSLTGLNNCQYYDVLTNPNAPDQVFAGSQDQGFQRNLTANTAGLLNFTQVISGDFGYLCLTGSPKHLWTQYPGGQLFYYNNPLSGYSSSWTMPGTQKPNYGWMLPVANVPDNNANTILMAGGNLGGGGGSYLTNVTAATSAPYDIAATQYNYDFRANSNNGTAGITAIEASRKDANRLYVATEDGTFFFSNNNGGSWTKSSAFTGPGPWYLYGSSIFSSRLTSNLLWYGGSGYSNSPVFRSTDGGVTFTAINTGLPSTIVHEIVANPAETMLFAATDAGPYVYIVAENKWYSMTGVIVPLQAYMSVEYIAATNTVRFGTYGRGIWDFQLSSGITFSGKVYLQGAFNSSTGLMDATLNSSGILQDYASAQPYNTLFGYAGSESVPAGFFVNHPDLVDWVLIELHDALNSSSLIMARAAFVKRDGTLVETDGSVMQINFQGVPAGSYYVVIRHRNHLGIRSAVALDFSSGTAAYDFTTAANKCYQSQAYTSTVQLGVGWGMRGGNANFNSNVKYNGPENDQDRILNTKLLGSFSNILTHQYATEDINMDGIVKFNGPDNDQNSLLNIVLGGLLSTIINEQL